jgi:hypothetical protein
MTAHFLAASDGALAAFGIFGLVGGFILAALYALFPLIVMWQLGGVKQRIDRQRIEELKALKGATEEIRTQNALTRQLLRAYGHEPEV